MSIKTLIKKFKNMFFADKQIPCNMGLQQNIGYFFQDMELLEEAVTHKSFANEKQHENSFGNERLEFLGDAVLELVISHILMERCKSCSEGKLSNMRAAIVNKDALSSIALQLDIGKYILLSHGEEENMGREKKTILSNVYEAVIAAVYYDGGYEKVFSMIESHFTSLLEEVAQKGFFRDYKSRLQEYTQRTHNTIPEYKILTVAGPNHRKIFEIQVAINDVCYGKGQGPNKKEAEQQAARRTLKELLNE